MVVRSWMFEPELRWPKRPTKLVCQTKMKGMVIILYRAMRRCQNRLHRKSMLLYTLLQRPRCRGMMWEEMHLLLPPKTKMMGLRCLAWQTTVLWTGITVEMSLNSNGFELRQNPNGERRQLIQRHGSLSHVQTMLCPSQCGDPAQRAALHPSLEETPHYVTPTGDSRGQGPPPTLRLSLQ